MDKRLAMLPLVVLAGTSLSGCVAAAIPALAGSAMLGKSVAEAGDKTGPDGAVSAVAMPMPMPAAAGAPAPEPAIVRSPAPAPSAVAEPASAPEPITPPQAAPVPMPPEVVTSATAPSPSAASPRSAAYPDPANPLAPNQSGFARFVRYTQESARQAASGAELPSAVLSDPVAIDGKRRGCMAGEQLVAVIDLDPLSAIFDPPASPPKLPGLALGLALLRQEGVEIAWLSDLSTVQSGALRTALEQSGLDPRGQDIISLRRDEGDSKDQRRSSLAGITCIIAIAGDERPDFDARFRYLRNPEAGAELEPLIGDGWFLIEPFLGQ